MLVELLHDREAMEIGRLMRVVQDLEIESEECYDRWTWHAEEMIDGDDCEGVCSGVESWDRYVEVDEKSVVSKEQLERLIDEEWRLARMRDDLRAIGDRVACLASVDDEGEATDFELIEDELREEAIRRDTRRQRERLISRLARGRSDTALSRSRVVRKTAKQRAVARRFERRCARRWKVAA